jgi:dimethylglycine dehydrogenase
LEAGLDRFVDLDKEFFGKDAMVETGIRVEMRARS